MTPTAVRTSKAVVSQRGTSRWRGGSGRVVRNRSACCANAPLLAYGVGVLPDLTAHVLTYGIGMVPDLTAHVFMPCVELLRQALRQGLMFGVQIPPRGLLGPEGEDAQERGGQRGLLVCRKPRLA
jgi:hypothetical protein